MMTRRIVLEIVLIIGLTIALAWLVLGVLALTDSADPVGTLVDQTPRVLFGLLGIALAVWTLLVIIGAIVLRRRRAAWRIAAHLVSLLVALVINIGLLTVLTVATDGGQGGGWGMLVVAIAVGAGGVLAIAGITAVLLVELVILRPTTAADPAAAAVSAPE
jgi:hypothetical protein